MNNSQDSANQANFANFNLNPSVLKALEDIEFLTPTPVQMHTIPEAMQGKDLTVQARTGSGKTAAFMIPALERCLADDQTQALILTPTRELAHQVSNEFKKLATHTKLKTALVIGGEDHYNQLKKLNAFPHFIIATPGRMLDHLKTGRLKAFNPSFLVLDEADEMLDMGFIDDVKEIIESCPTQRQTLCFSATMPKEIINLANSQLKDPKHICLAEKGIKHADIHQRLFVMKEGEKLEGLLRLIATDAPDRAIVFCKTRRNTDELAQKLISRGQNARALHGDLAMEARLKAVKDFTSGDLKIMVATDVASRGLDINNVTHVYNFHLAENTDRYTHRIGRTGRAGNKGVATTFATISEIRKNPFFRSHPYEKFDLSVIPNSKQFFEAVSQVQFNTVMDNEPSKKSLKTAKRLLSSNDPELVLAKYITELHKAIIFEGNEKIGFSPDEIKSELKFLSSRGPKKRFRGIPTKSGRNERGSRGGRRDRGSSSSRSDSRKGSTIKVRGDRKSSKPRRERRA